MTPRAPAVWDVLWEWSDYASLAVVPDLDESPASCEEITELLNALRQAVTEFQQRPAAPPPADKKVVGRSEHPA